MKLWLKQIIYVWHHFDEYYDEIKTISFVIFGFAPAISNFLIKHGLDIDFFYLGVAGQGCMWFYRWSQGEERVDRKKPRGVIVMAGHHIVAGFLAMLLTEYFFKETLIDYKLTRDIIAVGVGAFYEFIIKKARAVLYALRSTKDENE